MAQARHYKAEGLTCASTERGRGAGGEEEGALLRPGELADTAVLLRRHTDRVRGFNEAWWAQLQQRSVRDQVSFPFVAWRAGVAVRAMPGTIRDGSALGRKPSPHFRNVYHSNVRYAGGGLRFGPVALSVGYDAAAAKARADEQERAEEFE